MQILALGSLSAFGIICLGGQFVKIVNFGSLNIDYVYNVESIVRPGETIKALGRNVFCGGKGLNQSIALANAAADVYHAGLIGRDGVMLLDALHLAGVNTDSVKTVEGSSSHTFIQVNRSGQNSILFFAGDNLAIREDFIQEVINRFEQGDTLLLQNEIGGIPLIMKNAAAKGLKIVFNPSPVNQEVLEYPLELIDLFILNEIEGSMLTGCTSPDQIITSMMNTYKNAETVLTLGEHGAIFGCQGQTVYQPAFQAHVVDTTAAGDTFTGFFLAAYMHGRPVQEALRLAARAAAIAVTRPGAAPSIPKLFEVE
jgi:ribokinase